MKRRPRQPGPRQRLQDRAERPMRRRWCGLRGLTPVAAGANVRGGGVPAGVVDVDEAIGEIAAANDRVMGEAVAGEALTRLGPKSAGILMFRSMRRTRARSPRPRRPYEPGAKN